MKVGTLTIKRPRFFNGFAAKNGSSRLNRRQFEAARDLQQTWHKLALRLITQENRLPALKARQTGNGASLSQLATELEITESDLPEITGAEGSVIASVGGKVQQSLGSEKPSTQLALGITSASNGEGKTINCLGLASALAKETDSRVLVVESDLGNPSIASQLGLNPMPGLAEYLTEDASIGDTLRPTNLDNFEIIVAGGEYNRDTEWVSWNSPLVNKLRRRLPSILESLKRRYSYIILDMPPVLTNPYTKEIIDSLDGALLAVRADVTPVESMIRAVQDVGEDSLFGVLLVGTYPHLPSWLSRLLAE